MELTFGKIELENLINIVASVERTDNGQDNQWLNINAATVVCGDKEVKKVSFHIEYNCCCGESFDRVIRLNAENWTWNITWANNDISMESIKKLFTDKIATVGRDDDGFFMFEKMDEIIELNRMYKSLTKGKNDITYDEYIEYVKNYIACV